MAVTYLKLIIAVLVVLAALGPVLGLSVMISLLLLLFLVLLARGDERLEFREKRVALHRGRDDLEPVERPLIRAHDHTQRHRMRKYDAHALGKRKLWRSEPLEPSATRTREKERGEIKSKLLVQLSDNAPGLAMGEGQRHVGPRSTLAVRRAPPLQRTAFPAVASFLVILLLACIFSGVAAADSSAASSSSDPSGASSSSSPTKFTVRVDVPDDGKSQRTFRPSGASSEQVTDAHRRFVIIDAGSSGTRVHVFPFELGAEVKNEAVLLGGGASAAQDFLSGSNCFDRRREPPVMFPPTSRRFKPGLSSFQHAPGRKQQTLTFMRV